jgi:mannosyltransferase OCH1-like enzyme
MFKKRYTWILGILLLYWIVSRAITSPAIEPFERRIPLDIYQTWKTKDLPDNMKKCVDKLKRDNPEFTHHLYDDNDCYQFILTHFGDRVASAYDQLIPGAYKADLWRYCILYQRGGIYLDIKYYTINDFKLIDAVDKEYFVYDSTAFYYENEDDIADANRKRTDGVYNAFIVVFPGNTKLKNAIENIVENVKRKFYGNSPLAPTGPLLLSKEFSKNEMVNLPFVYNNQEQTIKRNGKPVLAMYNEYYSNDNKDNYYLNLWPERKVYKSD